ncbi:MAG: DUF2059 domain-containing protein [Rhodocyclaceae bacterium]|nr:DUF2059 domain-containing protein [Rhodocyclaceae bacterium]
MSTRLLPRLAATLLLALGLQAGAHAEPASAESVRALHEALGSARYTREAMDQLERQHAAAIANVAEGEARAAKAREHERVSAALRKLMAWEQLEPMAVTAYQAHLEAADVAALQRFLATPAGRLYVDKYTPAILQGTMASMALAGERAELVSMAVFDEGEMPAAMPAPPAPVGKREQAASALVDAFAREQFALQMREMDSGMKEQLRLLAPALGLDDDAEIEAKLDAFAAAFRADANFDAYMRPLVGALAAQLDETELAALSTAFARPEWKALEAKLDRANEAFQEALDTDLQQRIIPGVLKAAAAGD